MLVVILLPTREVHVIILVVGCHFTYFRYFSTFMELHVPEVA